MDRIILGLTGQQWLDIGISGAILLAVLLLGRWVISILLEKILLRITAKTKTDLDNQILQASRVPLYLLAVVFALDLGLSRLDFLPDSWDGWMGESFYVFYFLIVFIFAWRLIKGIFAWLENEVSRNTEAVFDEQLFPFFQRVVLILLAAIGTITILSHFNVDITAMVTTLGIGSLAVALAAQNTLEDTINGFMVMLDRPFRIGDRIEILDLNTWGDVVDIGLRSTRIRTRDNRMVVVPNSQIGKSLVVNYAYPNDQYRLEIHIGIAYGSDLEKARKVMVDAVREVEGVLSDRPVEALFLEFGDSSMIFRVRWWLESYVDTRRMFDRVNTALYKALEKENIQLPFPQLDVHMKS
jgi:small-conductance mechanosensitive channel